jgi:hypothetical protein
MEHIRQQNSSGNGYEFTSKRFTPASQIHLLLLLLMMIMVTVQALP